MKRRAWSIFTASTLLVTGLVIHQTGFPFGVRACRSSPRRVELHHLHATDPWTTEAANRYRQGTPTHWRDCVLQQ